MENKIEDDEIPDDKCGNCIMGEWQEFDGQKVYCCNMMYCIMADDED